jgi:hypothetical protein
MSPTSCLARLHSRRDPGRWIEETVRIQLGQSKTRTGRKKPYPISSSSPDISARDREAAPEATAHLHGDWRPKHALSRLRSGSARRSSVLRNESRALLCRVRPVCRVSGAARRWCRAPARRRPRDDGEVQHPGVAHSA